jgi:3-deoxy-7-phosphoheptulonate synthase
MLESHLYSGKQELLSNPSQLKYGVSITDPCLDWESTSELIRWRAAELQQSSNLMNDLSKNLRTCSETSLGYV